MNALAISLVSGAVVMLILALWLLKHSKEKRFQERMMTNFRKVLPYGTTVSGVPSGDPQSFWHVLRVRASIYAGFELQRKHLLIIPLALLFIGIAGWVILGLMGALFSLSIAVFIFGFLLPYTRLRRRQSHIIAQIPLFIDQILRSLSTGRSLESAIRFASNEARAPLRLVLDRVIRATDLGADMVESLSEAAKLHNLRELNLVALAMRISNNYGSSPRDMLDSVVKMVRQQELARRELAAMTGETRTSAWILGLIPIIIAVYTMIMNPNYLNMLVEDATGKVMLITALGMQGIGALILWRMLRSL